jgi:hypothetical protein
MAHGPEKLSHISSSRRRHRGLVGLPFLPVPSRGARRHRWVGVSNRQNFGLQTENDRLQTENDRLETACCFTKFTIPRKEGWWWLWGSNAR